MVTQSATRRQPRLLDGVLATMAAHNVYRFDASQFTTRQLLAPTCEDRSLARALAEGLHAYRLDASTWTVPSAGQANVAYTVRQWTGRLSCSCECGRAGGTVCKHRAIVAHELAKQPVAEVKPTPAAKPAIAPVKPATKQIRSIADLYDELVGD